MTTERPAPLSYTQLLRNNRAYRNLWLSQVVSNAGDWFSMIAVLALTLELTRSGLALSLTMLAQTLPSFLTAPVAGVVADRFNRKRVMIAADLIRSVVALGFLLVHRTNEVWMVFLFTALLSAVSPFFEAAKTASIPSIARGAELLGANALSSATWGIMLTVGSAVGGGVAALFGRSLPIAAVCITMATCASTFMWVFSSLGLQLVVHQDFRGRAFAADGGLNTLAFAVSTVGAGLFLKLFAPRTVAGAAGAMVLLSAVVWSLLVRSVPLKAHT